MPLDRFFSNKRVTSRGDTEILAGAQLCTDQRAKPALVQSCSPSPASSWSCSQVSSLGVKRSSMDPGIMVIPLETRGAHISLPLASQATPHCHFSLAVRCVTWRFGGNFSQSHVSGKNVCKNTRIMIL